MKCWECWENNRNGSLFGVSFHISAHDFDGKPNKKKSKIDRKKTSFGFSEIWHMILKYVKGFDASQGTDPYSLPR